MKWFKKLSIERPENQNSRDISDRKDRGVNNKSEDSTKNSKIGINSEERKQGATEFVVVDPEEFFQDPEHVRNYRAEAELLALLSDWEIIDDPNNTALDENFFSADFEDEVVALKSTPHISCFEVDGTKYSSVINQSTEKCEYSLLCGYKISNGIAISATVLEPTENNVKKTKVKRKKYTKPVLTQDSSDSESTENLIKRKRKISKSDALARSIMGAINKCPDCDDYDSDDLINPCSKKDHFDIQEYFKLDDSGNILLDTNHIMEEKGYGFLMKRTKKLQRSIICGKAIDEDYVIRRNIVDCIKKLFKALKDLFFGHPRNKTATGGPGDSVRAYTLQLASDHTSIFSRNIENFICCTKESREAAPQIVMRNMRQFMNGMKNYLVKHGEGDFQQEVEKARSHLKSDEFLNLDAILEAVMHQLVVLPLREHLYGMFVDFYTRSGDIQLLVENVKYACARNAVEFGIRPSVTPPTSAALHQISALLVKLQEAELPLDKLDLFLCVIATIFDATGCPRGQQLGADDFLPILVFVVAKCGFVGAEIEAEFMWGLLQPALLNGEAGYYLTALCSAVHVLKCFMSSENEGTGSLDWRSSSLPACSSVLRVIIPDECNGSLQTRTLPVRPHTTTREVCRIIAHKARITNPQDYGLFKLVDGEETLLADSECPQDARIAARGKHCMLAYKRIDAKIAWPTATQPSFA